MPQPVKRARTARTPAQPLQIRQPLRSAAKVRTFAPGAEAAPARRHTVHTFERCPGCALTPWPECACCGAPTVYAIEAGGVDSAGDLEHAHALTLCAACHAVLLEVRDPRAEPLRYLPLNTLQTKRVTKRAKQPAKQAVQAKRATAQPQRPTQPAQPIQTTQAKQPAQRTPRTPRTQRAKSSAKSATKGGAA